MPDEEMSAAPKPEANAPSRPCTKCGVTKPLTEFHWNRATGRQLAQCKSCRRAYLREWAKRTGYDRDARRRYLLADPKKRMMIRVRHRAKTFGTECTITEADFNIPTICPVLGIPIGHHFRVRDYVPSIDRIDNNKGYVPGNIIIVSWRANRIKSDAHVDELMLVAGFYGNLAGRLIVGGPGRMEGYQHV